MRHRDRNGPITSYPTATFEVSSWTFLCVCRTDYLSIASIIEINSLREWMSSFE